MVGVAALSGSARRERFEGAFVGQRLNPAQPPPPRSPPRPPGLPQTTRPPNPAPPGATVDVLRKLLKLPWSDCEAYVVKCMLKVRAGDAQG